MSEANSRDIQERLHQARVQGLVGDSPASPKEPSSTGNQMLDELIARTATIYSQAIRDDTRAAYARRWKKFESWCQVNSLTSMPAEPETVMLYLGALLSDSGASLNTLRGHSAAIGRVHREAGQRPPNDHPLLSQFMRGLARHSETRPARPTNTGALRISDVRRVMAFLATLETDVRARRDAALLALHWAGFGDGELQRLLWDDVVVGTFELAITVRAVRDGQADAIRRLPFSAIDDPIPHAVLCYRALVDAGPGKPVFTAVDPSGWVSARPLAHRAIFKLRTSRVDSLMTDGDHLNTLDVTRILSGTPSEVLRDRALLLLGFAMSARRGEVVNLRWSDIVTRAGGIIVHIRSSKTDLSGKGVDLGVPSGQSVTTDPVAALVAWRDRVALQLGTEAVEGERWIFTHVGRAGRLTETRLTPEALTRLVRRRASQAGITERMGGRSLRAGFITTAAELGIPIDEIARQSRHKTLDSLVLYVRTADPLLRSPAGEVGL